jgi:hypothetical protein
MVGIQYFRGLSPACRVPTLRLVTHCILVLSLAFNLGININLNHPKEGLHMVKTTNSAKVAGGVKNKTAGLGCVGKRSRKSG